MVDIILWTLLGYLLGSILFSYWVTLLVTKIDIRQFGDGNPGGMNAMKYADWRIGLPASVLDLLKGVVPVALAQSYGISGWGLVPVALAPVLGHAFSIFLNFQGGKAVATSLGVWLVLGGQPGIMAYAFFALLLLALQQENALAAVAGMLGLGLQLWLSKSPNYLLAAWTGNSLIMFWKHRLELRQPIQMRSWTTSLFSWRAR